MREIVEEYNVRTLKADFGTEDEAVGRLMDQVQQSRQIPLLVVFPAGRPNNPVVFQGGYTQRGVIKAIRDASPKRVALLP